MEPWQHIKVPTHMHPLVPLYKAVYTRACFSKAGGSADTYGRNIAKLATAVNWSTDTHPTPPLRSPAGAIPLVVNTDETTYTKADIEADLSAEAEKGTAIQDATVIAYSEEGDPKEAILEVYQFASTEPTTATTPMYTLDGSPHAETTVGVFLNTAVAARLVDCRTVMQEEKVLVPYRNGRECKAQIDKDARSLCTRAHATADALLLGGPGTVESFTVAIAEPNVSGST